MQRWDAYSKALVEAGVFVAGEGLQSSTTATTARGRTASGSVTDGPFAETKEQLGGFYVLDCKDLDEALDWAAQAADARSRAASPRSGR